MQHDQERWREWTDVPERLQVVIQESDGQHIEQGAIEALTDHILRSLSPILIQRVEAGLERQRVQFLVKRCRERTGESVIRCIQAVAIHVNKGADRVKQVYYGQE